MDKATIETKLNEFEKQEKERINNSIKWGAKEHPIDAGDICFGTVEALEKGKSPETADITFIGMDGQATINGETVTGKFSILANSVLSSKIDEGMIAVGKNIAIKYLGKKTPQKAGRSKYSNYLVMPINE